MLRYVIVALALLEAGWFTFDGSHALIKGDYVTPKSGPRAGQLGPWHHLVSAVGIEPRSTTMKAIHLVTGLAWLCIIGAYLAGASWAPTAMLVAAVATLWYLPVGTLLSAIQIVLLLIERRSIG